MQGLELSVWNRRIQGLQKCMPRIYLYPPSLAQGKRGPWIGRSVFLDVLIAVLHSIDASFVEPGEKSTSR